MAELDTFEQRRAAHQAWQSEYTAAAEAAEALENRISALRLATFIAAGITLTSALTGAGVGFVAATLVLVAGFVAAVAYHARIARRRGQALARAEVHRRHLARMQGESPGRHDAASIETEHAYAHDIDVSGAYGLLARIDVTHSVRGADTLVHWLCSTPAVPNAPAARQTAVRELARQPAFRRELEAAAATHGRWDTDLNDAAFLRFTELPSLFAAHPWLRPVMWLLPAWTVAAVLTAQWADIHYGYWLVPLALQLGLLRWSSGHVHRALDWITARLGVAQSFEEMLRLLESADFEAPALQALQQRLIKDGVSAGEHMRRLARYEGYAQLRTQGPVYIVVNALTLWDLFCLERLENFNTRVGADCVHWFEALGELEALSSLATLADVDPDACFPEIAQDGPLRFDAVAHPLLPPETRVGNDVQIEGPKSAWVITGSNMAGKSTLLRSIGLNVVLALAGGPVIARCARVPWVRLRASMRIDDSLQRGASYFRAELTKLQSVVADLGVAPPVLFLLDEVLRGTNSRARSVGARAVVRHLLAQGAFGLVATHDAGLASLESEPAFRVHNYHFTDVFEQGEMRFDYRLQPGVVQSSNALRLLQMAGIEIHETDRDPGLGSGSRDALP